MRLYGSWWADGFGGVVSVSPHSLRGSHVTGVVGGEEAEDMKFKLTPVKCKYHDVTKGAEQIRCLACGVPYDRKKEKLFKYVDGRKKK